MNFSIKIPGSCGELVQGMINDVPFLVTCPIDMYAKASMSSYFSYLPYKAKLARTKTLDYLKIKSFNKFCLITQLLAGKGMASSSADIAAICQLTALSCGKKLTEDEIAKISTSIEPTDGVFCKGIVRFNHLNGDILEHFGLAPKLKILMFDCGGKIDTLSFNRRRGLKKLYQQNEKTIIEALDLLRLGFKEKNTSYIGRAAAMSAYANQKILYKKQLEDIMIISENYDAVGVNVAHSGTVIGVLFNQDTDAELVEECRQKILSDCFNLNYLNLVNMISGGIFIEKVNS